MLRDDTLQAIENSYNFDEGNWLNFREDENMLCDVGRFGVCRYVADTFRRESQLMLEEINSRGNGAERGHAYGIVGLVLAAISFALAACVVVRCYLRRAGSRGRPPRVPVAEEEGDDAESTV